MEKKKNDLILILVLILIIIILGIIAFLKFGNTLNKSDSETSLTGDFQSLLENFDETGKDTSKVNIGDYVDYKPIENTSYELKASVSGNLTNQTILRDDTLKWRVLGFPEDKTQIQLISDKPTSGEYIYFKGIKGYNNIVYLLNNICDELYSNYLLGDARSINIEDIQTKMSTVWNYNMYDNGIAKYGETKKYTGYDTIKYPNIFDKEIGQAVDGKTGTDLNLSSQNSIMDGTSTAIRDITVKQTFWKKDLQDNNFINSIYYELFINNGSNYKEYYLASRYVEATKDYPKYGASRIGYGMLRGDPLYFKLGEVSNSAFIRPIIILNNNVQVDISNNMQSGTQDNPWIIK